MRYLLALVMAALIFSVDEARAIDRVVTIEGPVSVMREPGTETTYWVQDSKQMKYRVFMTEPERARLTTVIEKAPTSVIRFDGTIVDDEATPTIRVSKWDTVTTTTKSYTNDGRTVTSVEERNTTYRPTN